MDPDEVLHLETVSAPRASVYVVEAHARRPATEALVAGILARYPTGRVVVMAEKFQEAGVFALLRLGIKGLLTYGEASEQLPRALREVMAGAYWVPRYFLSRFVASLNAPAAPRLAPGAEELTPREREVLRSLLENLSNKEIAKRLQISERTAKFHVSNLLNKYGVKRRADLILLNFTQTQRAPGALRTLPG